MNTAKTRSLATMYTLYTHESVQRSVNISVSACEILVVVQF